MDKTFEAIIRFIEEEVPFDKYLGIKVEELREGFARLFLPFREEFIGDKRRPALHGGIISALIDTCGGAAVWTHFTTQDRISTVDIRVDYLRPGPADDIIAESEVIRVGNRVGVVHTRVSPSKDKTIVFAEGRAVYNIRRARV
ncbi:MAG: PaaI family thioesterase [Deltaproteobacteria bacterium]|nr:PaaI family thioesterase [Deltaproteobacteria bacterium]